MKKSGNNLNEILQNTEISPELIKLFDSAPPNQRELEERVYSLLAAVGAAYKVIGEQDAETLTRSGRLFERVKKEYPAYIVVLNYNPNNPTHLCVEPLNGKNNVNGNSIYDINVELFADLGTKDGAMLVKPNSIIVAEQRLNVFGTYSQDRSEATWEKRGFKKKVGTRFFSGQDASRIMKGTIVYVTSGENPGDLRRFVEGNITYSTITGEPGYATNENVVKMPDYSKQQIIIPINTLKVAK